MRLAVRARNFELAPALRDRIETRVRLSIGSFVADVETLQLTLAEHPAERRGGYCEVTLRCLDGEQTRIEERAGDREDALEVALWRIGRWLRRRELR